MINKLSVGTAQFGFGYGIDHKNLQVSQPMINQILNFCSKNNIKSIDTAKSYCSSEKNIGEYFKNHNYKGWDITTKIDHIKEPIKDQLVNSKEKLKCKPSTLLAHSINLYKMESFQKQIKELKQENIELKTGVSVYTNDDIEKALEYQENLDVIQLPLNILDTRLIRKGVLKKINSLSIEIHARSIFLKGLLYLSKFELDSRFKGAVKSLNFLKNILKKENLTLAEYSLLFVASRKEITKVVVGIENLVQLKEHCNTLRKHVDSKIFFEALALDFNDEYILNPSLW